MTATTGRPGVAESDVVPTQAPTRRRGRRVLALACAALAFGLLVTWVVRELTSRPSVAVVGDSITALSRSSIATALSNAGYAPTISAVPGAKIGQAQNAVTQLAQQAPDDWILELGTDDAGAHNEAWNPPFLAEWRTVSAARCVIYVTVSPVAGPVADQIDAAIETLAASHPNVHVLDWGNLEYTNPAWVRADKIHPTPEGQRELANLETAAVQRDCPRL